MDDFDIRLLDALQIELIGIGQRNVDLYLGFFR